MPAPKREKTKVFSVDLPEDVAGRLMELVAQTGRSAGTEIRLALEFWLERQGIGESAVEPGLKPSARRTKRK
jgi:predicted transcriptional regulator